MKSLAEAQREVLAAFAPLPAERRALLAAQGAFLAAALHAREDAPAFDNSAMDGFALAAGTLEKASAEAPCRLPLAFESRAGGPTPPPLPAGCCARIFTGAPLPEGADTVVMQEVVSREGDHAVFVAPAPLGSHVRSRGSDIQLGEAVAPAGAAVGPGEIGALAAQGFAAVSVHRRPRVALLSTGDELRDIGDPARPGSIVNSNAYALAAQVLEAGGEPWILPNAPDRLDAIVDALNEGLQADLLISCGGVSVGDHDLVHQAFARAGIETAFWKVAVKPGKPLAFGVGRGTPVLGLPGNPISAMVTFELFARPAIRRMVGDPRPHRRRIKVRLTAPHSHRTGRIELARATLLPPEATGAPHRAQLHSHQGSGSLPSMVAVDLLVILPAEQADFTPEQTIEALWVRPGLGSAQAFAT